MTQYIGGYCCNKYIVSNNLQYSFKPNNFPMKMETSKLFEA